MVRLRSHLRRAASAGPGPATARHREEVRGANGLKPAYKVVVEETVRPRRKLITSTYAEKEPPPGYTFVPAGDPQLTAQCKEFARQDGMRIYVVSTTKHQDTQLSMEVHRIGYHVPSSIVERVCTSLGLSLDHQGHAVRRPGPRHFEKPRMISNRKGLSRIDRKALKNMHQKEVDREARQAILDLFPAIPKADLDVIVDRAFDLGSKKVGTQVEDLSLPRRVQLAVVAHIRHIYTDYDNVLNQVPWLQARALVEQACLEKLAVWRGDEEEDPNAMEEILQEIIVIPDDEESEVQESRSTDPRTGELGMEEAQRVVSSDTHLHLISPSPPPAGESEVTHLGSGQYAFKNPNPGWTERVRVHQAQTWKQAQSRVKKRLIGSEVPNQRSDLAQQSGSTQTTPYQVRYDYQNREVPLAMSSDRNSRLRNEFREKRHMPSELEGTRQSVPNPVTPGNIPPCFMDGELLPSSDNQAMNGGRYLRSFSQVAPISYLSPEDPLPSVEPATPRQAHRLEIASRIQPEVVYVDYSHIEQDQPLKRFRSAKGRFPERVFRTQRPIYIADTEPERSLSSNGITRIEPIRYPEAIAMNAAPSSWERSDYHPQKRVVASASGQGPSLSGTLQIRNDLMLDGLPSYSDRGEPSVLVKNSQERRNIHASSGSSRPLVLVQHPDNVPVMHAGAHGMGLASRNGNTEPLHPRQGFQVEERLQGMPMQPVQTLTSHMLSPHIRYLPVEEEYFVDSQRNDRAPRRY